MTSGLRCCHCCCVQRTSSEWVDQEWAAAVEESTQALAAADSATAAAIKRDERRTMRALRKMAPSHVRTVLLARHSSRLLGARPASTGRCFCLGCSAHDVALASCTRFHTCPWGRHLIPATAVQNSFP